MNPGAGASLLNSNSRAPEMDGESPSELDHVLLGRAFEKAPTLRKLLIYLWGHRHDDVGEYAIATEALGRKADFDPRVDATVRVLVSRLRQRLKDFYETDGVNLPARIVIPVGSHQVQVVEVERQSAPEQSEAAPREISVVPDRDSSRIRGRRIIASLLIVIALLLASNGWFLWDRNRTAAAIERGATRRLPKFWENFLGNGSNTRIVVPTPVFFNWPNGLMARDVNVNEFSRMGESRSLAALDKQYGKPTLAQQYVAASDTFASLRLGRYLDPKGTRISILTTADSPLDTIERENLIMTGTPRTLAPYQNLLDRLSFEVDAIDERVIDRRPAAGVPPRFETVHESPSRFTTPGIIASLPGGPAGTHVLILVTTYYTSALVSYLTSEAGLNELQQAQHAHRDCPYFEAVIVSEIDGRTELKSRLVVFRPYIQKP